MLVEMKMTQGDIDAGVRHSCYHCPIAVMTRRILFPLIPRARRLRVGTGYIWIGKDETPVGTVHDADTLFEVNNVKEIEDFVVAFDNQWGVSPITITVDVPEASLV